MSPQLPVHRTGRPAVWVLDGDRVTKLDKGTTGGVGTCSQQENMIS